MFLFERDTNTKQKAFFGELSYDITDKISATIGGRYFEYEREISTDSNFAGSIFDVDGDESDNSLKVNISWTPDEETLIYGQWSEGYRLGKPQLKPNPAFCDIDNDGLVDGLGFAAPDATESDTSENFELGIRKSFADDRASLSATIYRVNWDGMPVRISPPCGFSFALNAGRARSEGVELELRTILSENVRLDITTSYGESKLKEDIPLSSDFGSDGDNLPGSADFNVSLGLEYLFSFAGHNMLARADYSYVGDYYHNFSETGQSSGGYSQLNLKGSLDLDEFDIEIFVNNITNANEFTWVETSLNAFGAHRAYRLRPRTVGVNLSYSF